MGEEAQEREHLAQDAAEDLELGDESADGVKGGDSKYKVTQDVTVNKAKTADKQFYGDGRLHPRLKIGPADAYSRAVNVVSQVPVGVVSR